MPYANVPSALTAKMDRCVESVQKGGKSKEAAIRICWTSVVGKGVGDEAKKRLKGGKS